MSPNPLGQAAACDLFLMYSPTQSFACCMALPQKAEGPVTRPLEVRYCDRGTCGPAGGASCWRSVSSTPPPGDGAGGAPGAGWLVGAPVFRMTVVGLRSMLARIDSRRL